MSDRPAFRASQGVRRLERRDDAFERATLVERRHRLCVRHGFVLHPTDGVQEGVFWSDAGVIQAGGNRMCFLYLSVRVL